MKQVALLALTIFAVATADYPQAKDDVLLQTKGAMKSKDVETDGMQAAAPQCACENPGHGTFSSCTSSRTCACNGRARLGYGSRWSSWKDVQGSIQCTNGAFGGDPHPGQAKECQCEAALNYIGAHASGLDLCQGDCDNDSDCQGSLVCFQRHGNNYATVPGCAGTPYADNEDYCVQVSSSMLQKEEAKKQKSESKKGVRPKAKALNPWPAKSEKRDVATVKAEKKEKKRVAKPIKQSLLETYKLRAKRGCEHTDNGAADPYGDDCNDYDSYPNWCGGYDSSTFTSAEMCCACGGGVEASQCACENPGHGTFASCTSNRNCNCNGQVRMGYGNRWTSWRDVSGSIQCTNGAFGGDPAPGQAKECQCAAASGYSVGDSVVIDGDTAWITGVLGGGQYSVDYRDGHTSYEVVSESEIVGS